MMAQMALSQRDRRTLVLGTSLIVTMLVARALPMIRAWESQQIAEADAAAQDLRRLADGVRVLPAIRDSVRARQLRVSRLDSSGLSGESPAAIAAALSSNLEETADDNSLKVTTLQLQADSGTTLGLARVQVRLTGVTDVAGLAGFLRDVESGPALLVVRDLSVSQPEPAASDSKPEALRIDVLVAGLGVIKAGGQR